MMSDRGAPSVLFLLSSLRTGGSESKTVRLANTLASRGIRVTLAYLGPPLSLRDAISSDVIAVDLRRRGKVSLRALWLLLRTVREQKAETIVAVNLYAALYAALARALLRGRRRRFMACLNTTDVRTRKLALQMILYRTVLKTADVLIFGAEAQRQLWRERYRIGAESARTRVIYNGVDTQRFAPMPAASREIRRALPTRFAIGTVGQLRPEKSQTDLVRAGAILRSRGLDVGVLIVGSGPERPRIEAEIERLGMQPYVALAGESRDVRPYLMSMDVFVLCSTAIETFSNAALEALSCGVPVVASEIGGMRELLGFGGGTTYPVGDVTSLCERLAPLLTDPRYRQRLAAEARQAALEHFGWEQMVQQFASVLSGSDDRSAPPTIQSGEAIAQRVATRV